MKGQGYALVGIEHFVGGSDGYARCVRDVKGQMRWLRKASCGVRWLVLWAPHLR